MLVIGIDVSRGKATVCPLEKLPIDLLEFARSYKPLTFKTNQEDLENLANLGEVFILEPTGSDHKIYVEYLKSQGKTVLGCTGTRVRNFARDSGILNKSDREDAAVIAAFGLRHLQAQNFKAFISIDAIDIKEKYRSMQALIKQRTQLINQLRSRLVYECPELHDAKSHQREWLKSRPPAVWRAIAGEELESHNAIGVPAVTVGRGISELSRQLAVQICSLERLQFALECECDELLNGEDLGIYSQVMNRWSITPMTQTAIVSAIYPIEQFLDDGKQVRRRAYSTERSKHNRTVRNRSLKQFKRALGAGRMWIQSGKKEFWAKTGDPQTRSAIYAYLSFAVVTRRQPTLQRLHKLFPELAGQIEGLKPRKRTALLKEQYSFRALIEKAGIQNGLEPWKDERLIKEAARITKMSEAIARLQLFYEFAPQCQAKGKTERLMKIYPRFVEWLYRDLVTTYQDDSRNHRVSSVLRDDFEQALELLEIRSQQAS